MQAKVFGYLVEIARSGSFYRAAKNLGVSQQGLNKAIASLEEELGVKLLERSAQGVRLTRTGELALGHAQEIQGQYNLLLQDIEAEQAPAAQREDRVKVHVSFYSAQVAAVDRRYVDLLTKNLLYYEEPFDKLLRHAQLSDGSDLIFADVQARTLREIRAEKKLRFEPILATKLGFLWKEGSPLANVKKLHRETVAKVPLAVCSAREPALFFERLFRETPMTDVRLEASSPQLLMEYVRAGDGVACTCDSFGYYLLNNFSPQAMHGLHFTPLSTPEAFNYLGFLLPVNVTHTPEARQVIEVLRRHLQTYCAEYFEEYPLEV